MGHRLTCTPQPGWLKVTGWSDLFQDSGPLQPPPESLMFTKPATGAVLAVSPLKLRGEMTPRRVAEFTAAGLAAKDTLLSPLEETEDGRACSFSWTDADGMRSGKLLVRLPPENPTITLVVLALWPAEYDAAAEVDAIAASVKLRND